MERVLNYINITDGQANNRKSRPMLYVLVYYTCLLVPLVRFSYPWKWIQLSTYSHLESSSLPSHYHHITIILQVDFSDLVVYILIAVLSDVDCRNLLV